jgi:hypothetical protein
MNCEASRDGHCLETALQTRLLLGNDHENQPQEEGGLDAVETGRIVGTSEMLKLHLVRMIADCRKYDPSEKRRGQIACRLLGMSSLKKGAMWHICSKQEL